MSQPAWPVVAGSYEVGDPGGSVAVCVTTSEELIAPLAHVPGVAITGKVYTANLGIERIVVNIMANPAIRFLLICGKDSPLFHPGQSLVALAERGVDAGGRIIDALGYEPALPTLTATHIAQFQRQVEVVDWAGEEDVTAITDRVAQLAARNPGPFAGGAEALAAPLAEQFTPIKPGGQREPLQYDPKGYFVITLDRDAEQIVLRHYLPDNTPAHEMRGRMAGSMLLGLLREGLVSQLSHAGYLGEELAKAQTALTLGLRYDQDRPLRPREAVTSAAPPAPPDSAPEQPAPRMGKIALPLTWAQLQAAPPGTVVDAVIAITDQPAPDVIVGTLLEPDEAEPFNAFRRTDQQQQARWTEATRMIMGERADVHAGALIRAHGPLGADQAIDADQIVILSNVARVVEG